MAGNTIQQLASEVSVEMINAQPAMQLATCQDTIPWNCSVYFVIYHGSFYWLSFPDRRHSQDLAVNPNAAIAVVLQSVQPVIGVQAEGGVHIVQDIDEAEAVLNLYIEKYNQGSQFVALLKEGKNRHTLYCLSPKRVMLFDERDVQAAGMPKELSLI